MKRLKATLAALVVSASVGFPVFATTQNPDEGAVFTEVAKITKGNGGSWGKAEWSSDQDKKKVRLQSYGLMGAVAGLSIANFSGKRDYDNCLDIKSFEFELDFKDQVHAHVRPTVRIRCIAPNGNGRSIDIPWDKYKDSKGSGMALGRYVVNVQQLLAETSKEDSCPYRAWSISIGGQEIRRDGFGNNGFMDFELRFPAIRAISKKSKEEYPVQIIYSTDVKRLESDADDKDTDGLKGSV